MAKKKYFGDPSKLGRQPKLHEYRKATLRSAPERHIRTILNDRSTRESTEKTKRKEVKQIKKLKRNVSRNNKKRKKSAVKSRFGQTTGKTEKS